MDLDKLKIFYHVALVGSLKQAEHSLGIKSPSISKHLAGLESDLGTKLFKRYYKGLMLTPSGKKLFASVQHIMDETDSIIKNFKQEDIVQDNLEGTLRILTTTAMACYYTMAGIQKFKERHPGVIVKVNCKSQIANFTGEEADIAILGKATEGIEFINKTICTNKTRLLASEQYLQKYGNPKTVEDLVHHRCIAFGYDELVTTNYLDLHIKEAKKIDPSYEAHLYVNSFVGYIEACVRGMGIIYTADNYPYEKKFNLIKILDNITVDTQLFMTYQVSRGRSRKILEFEEIMKEIYNGK